MFHYHSLCYGSCGSYTTFLCNARSGLHIPAKPTQISWWASHFRACSCSASCDSHISTEVLLASRYLKNHLCIDVRTITSLTADSCSGPGSDKGTVWISDFFFPLLFTSSLIWCQRGWSKLSPLPFFNLAWHTLFPSCAQRQLLLRNKALPFPTSHFVPYPVILTCQRTLGRHSFCTLLHPKLK